MKVSSLVVLVAAAAAAFPSVVQAGPTPAQEAALERLQGASSTPVSVEFADGAARFVAATVPVDGDSATERALAYLDEYRDLYGLASPREQLQVMREAGGEDGQDVFFGQSVDGVPIDGSQLAVHLRGPAIVATNGAYLPLLPTGTKPVISAMEASDVAQKAAGAGADPVLPPELTYFDASLTMNEAERGVWGLDAEAHLAWNVSLPTRTSVVDARTGRELLGYDPHRHADISINTVNNTSPGPFCSWPGAVEWYDEFTKRPGVTTDTEGDLAWTFTHDTYSYYFTKFSRLSYDGRDGHIRVILDAPTSVFSPPSVGAAYNTHCHDFYFTNNMATKDVVAHEFTHGVTDFTAHFVYLNQPGALDEHYADFFGAMIDPDWTIGEGSALGAIRDMSNPPAFGHPDNMGAFVVTPADSGGVHTNNGIPNKVAFLITDGGFHRGFQINGLGRTKAERLYYDVLTRLLTRNSNFMAQRGMTVFQASTWAASGTHGFTAGDACDVRNAFASAGLGVGDADCDGTGDSFEVDDDNDGRLDSTDNCVSIANPSQLDTDFDGMGDACDRNDDNDSRLDTNDNCPLVRNDSQKDTDGDGLGDACDPTPSGDLDYDGVDDARDNCRGVYNPDQRDEDKDGIGNACDTFNDNDRDGVANAFDNCVAIANADQSDGDGDGVGDVCDNAPAAYNPDQADTDGDGNPDALDPDDDNDGVDDALDNCQFKPNPKQEDADRNGVGDACESILRPEHDLHLAFVARDRYFERFQILLDPCFPECGDPGGTVASTVLVDSEHRLELQLLDPRGEVVATGVSGEPLSYEATIGEDGRAEDYRLEILPSPNFEPGREYPFTASMSDRR